MRFRQYIMEQQYYDGPPLEAGGTSIRGNASPAIQWLYNKGMISENHIVLDYGAGKYARNADWLRDRGIRVYAYDPFNSNGTNGWEVGTISSKLPNKKFDIGFTSFVLNVVPKYIEDDIIKKLKAYCKNQYHVTRNKDIFEMVKKAVLRRDKVILSFIADNFYKNVNYFNNINMKSITDDEIMSWCEFGVETIKGFQRIPKLEKSGFKLLKNTTGYKIYIA